MFSSTWDFLGFTQSAYTTSEQLRWEGRSAVHRTVGVTKYTTEHSLQRLVQLKSNYINEDDPSLSSFLQASLFSRLQSALPPNIVATVNNTTPESLKHVTDNVDFAGIRSNLLTEFQRVQGVTCAQAEEYVHKSHISPLCFTLRRSGGPLTLHNGWARD
ncbi:uncharacterized protein LACBIDRAFT_324999 [Laccaria bicolor S238N-H82]|uniref:Predicted protein n=1 Tax=Laccaria bicolor (strain S238N-H82 / ATCC MYA-4686) TaxID=486041 RepID=B0D3R1_LACBS|nr:uncharacterized protein LACBIDRAFT_324999 [Laccaria bicolor S238N-H82]EDR10972.1 predicted protein [Laccaria bicolor S238N-H82]|eukprot:XP_001878273.1 predicted protein [Laccaria bicolor S238N-H82]